MRVAVPRYLCAGDNIMLERKREHWCYTSEAGGGRTSPFISASVAAAVMCCVYTFFVACTNFTFSTVVQMPT